MPACRVLGGRVGEMLGAGWKIGLGVSTYGVIQPCYPSQNRGGAQQI